MKNTIQKTLKTECFLTKLLFQTDMRLGIVYWLTIGAQYAIPLVSVWLWKLILDELTAIYLAHTANICLWLYLAIYLVLQVLVSSLVQTVSVISQTINRKAACHLDMAIMRKMAHTETAFFDNPENKDKLAAAQTSETFITGNMCWAVDTMIRTIAFISGLVLFLSYDLILGLIYMATYVPGSILSYKHKARVNQWSLYNIPETRKKDYYKSLLTGKHTAKDLRLYNLADHFIAKYNELWNRIRGEREKLFIKGATITFLASLLTYIGIAVILLLSVRSVLAGTMAIGTLALYIGLAQESGENFKGIVEDLACQIEIDVPRVIHYLEFLNYENAIRDEGTEKIPEMPDIEFRNVSFKYPGNEEYTLNDLSFKLEGGKKIALVGVNGAGKTTLVKLLLRFYEPDSGSILIGGRDIRSYPLEQLHRLFGVCFQDIQSYSLTLRENIAISDIDRLADDGDVRYAAEAADALGIIDAAAGGLDTQMTRAFENDGMELSGGQWQKIALARAFFRNSQFIILDEPSSALDPEAEDYIFSSFKRLCHDRGGILISHRLSSIMMVDEIVLLEHGRVAESGTHEQLMEMKGKYAQMYKLQAEKYVGGGSNE